MLPKYINLYKCPSCRNHIVRQTVLEGTNKNAELYSDGRYIAPQLPQLPKLVKCKRCETIFWLHKQGKVSTRVNDEACRKASNLSARDKILSRYAKGIIPEKPGIGDYSNEFYELNSDQDTAAETSQKFHNDGVSIFKSTTSTISDKSFEKIDKAEYMTIEDYFFAISKGLAENNKEELEIRIKIWWTYNDRVRKGLPLYNDEDDEADWKLNLIELLVLLDKNDFNDKILIAEIFRSLGDFNRCLSIINTLGPEYSWISENFKKQCEIGNKLVFKLY